MPGATNGYVIVQLDGSAQLQIAGPYDTYDDAEEDGERFDHAHFTWVVVPLHPPA